MEALYAQANIELVFGKIFEQHYTCESSGGEHGLQNYQNYKQMKRLGPLLHICSIEKNICQVIGISSFSLSSFNCPSLFF
jgi:uncharacterized hydantoinase/oxoprolinase family protein